MAFTRDWDEAAPTDANFAYEIDDYMRYLRVDVSDRIKDMIYGFTAGENDGNMGFKELTFKQKSAASGTPNADEIVLYALDDGSNCGLYAKNEDGYTKQILKKVGTSLVLNLESGDTTESLGSITVSGLTASGDLDIGDYELRAQTLEADVATGTAPMTIASTTKVTNLNADKVDGYDVAAYAGAESYTYPGGRIEKHGVASCNFTNSVTTKAISFGAAFTNDCVRVYVSLATSSLDNNTLNISATDATTTGFNIKTYSNNTLSANVNWLAIGY